MEGHADPGRYSALEVSLACPKCRSTGLVPWDRLDRVLGCGGCGTLYRVEPHGLVEIEAPEEEAFSVQVRSGAGEWQKHKAIVCREPTPTERLREVLLELPMTWRGRIAIAIVVLAVALIIATLRSSDTDKLASLPLPDSLEERAVLVAEAAAHRDTELLLQLTDPLRHRALRIWLAHGKDLPKHVGPEKAVMASRIVAGSPSEDAASAATIRVQIQLPPDGEECLLTQEWVKRADTWYFRPALVRSPPPPKAEPFQKQRPRRG